MRDAPACRSGDCGHFSLVLFVCLEDDVAQLVLRRRVDDRAQQREAATLAVHGVLPRRKRDVPPAALALP